MRSQVRKSTVRDKVKLAQNFLTKLRFLAEEVRSTTSRFKCSRHAVVSFHRLNVSVPFLTAASTQHSRCLPVDDKQRETHRLRTRSLERHPLLHRGGGDGKGLWQGQDDLSEGEFTLKVIDEKAKGCIPFHFKPFVIE